MKVGKLTSPLVQKLQQAPAEELLDVVVELARPAVPEAVRTASRAERIASLQETFQRGLAPVEQAIQGAGGEVTGKAWINQTVRARLPVKAVEELTELNEVQVLDLPHALEPESF